MSDADRQRRRHQILDAVVDITTTGGLQAATFRTVAEAAGVSVRLVQYYFGTKDELLRATLAHVGAEAAERVQRRTAALGPDPAPKAHLAAILDAFLPLDEDRRRAMLVFQALRVAALTDPGLASSEQLGLGRSLVGVVEDLLRAAGRQGGLAPGADPRSEAVVLVSVMAGVATDLLAGHLTRPEARRLVAYAVDRALPPARDKPPSTRRRRT